MTKQCHSWLHSQRKLKVEDTAAVSIKSEDKEADTESCYYNRRAEAGTLDSWPLVRSHSPSTPLRLSWSYLYCYFTNGWHSLNTVMYQGRRVSERMDFSFPGLLTPSSPAYSSHLICILPSLFAHRIWGDSSVLSCEGDNSHLVQYCNIPLLLQQWFSTFLMLWPFNIALHVIVTPQP